MATLGQIRQAVADMLEPLTRGVNGFQVSPKALASPTLPYIYVIPADNAIDYHRTMGRGAGALSVWTLEVRAQAALIDDIASQEILDPLMEPAGARSVRQLVEHMDDQDTNPTLGGVVDDVTVTECSGYRQIIRDGAGSALEVVWTLSIHSKGDQ